MHANRRTFLKASSLLGLASAAFNVQAANRLLPGQRLPWKLHDTKEFVNICCYCSGGCGTICSVRNGKVVNIEGDPDNPCNLGGLCPKGAALIGLLDIVDKKEKLVPHPYRLTQPLVRRPVPPIGNRSNGAKSSMKSPAPLRRHVMKPTRQPKTA